MKSHINNTRRRSLPKKDALLISLTQTGQNGEGGKKKYDFGNRLRNRKESKHTLKKKKKKKIVTEFCPLNAVAECERFQRWLVEGSTFLWDNGLKSLNGSRAADVCYAL
ncbi:hypothetical protein CEXT_593101 [Caerostris extrusa]|uniref:Uncharacterized protein n=1 Tax=Caerostris extrusa TaxID=172846 RepID=A0AAV4N9W6_CAEEX|nr:hypothetical protein CEXT_593101 [Caerostris extrusa]